MFIYSCTWTDYNGIRYKTGGFVVIENSLMPLFGKITDIIVINTEECFFIVSVFITETFISHYHAYEVLPCNPAVYDIVRPNDLIDYHVYHAYKVLPYNMTLIPLKYHLIENI